MGKVYKWTRLILERIHATQAREERSRSRAWNSIDSFFMLFQIGSRQLDFFYILKNIPALVQEAFLRLFWTHWKVRYYKRGSFAWACRHELADLMCFSHLLITLSRIGPLFSVLFGLRTGKVPQHQGRVSNIKYSIMLNVMSTHILPQTVCVGQISVETMWTTDDLLASC